MTGPHIQLLIIRHLSSSEGDPSMKIDCSKDATTNIQADVVHCMVAKDRSHESAHCLYCRNRFWASPTEFFWCPPYEQIFSKNGFREYRHQTKSWPGWIFPESLWHSFGATPILFTEIISTQDQTFACHFNPDSEVQSRWWKHHGLPPLKKFKQTTFAGTFMASVFPRLSVWHHGGISSGRSSHHLTVLWWRIKRTEGNYQRKKKRKLRGNLLLLPSFGRTHLTSCSSCSWWVWLWTP